MTLSRNGVEGAEAGLVVAAYGRLYRVELEDHTEIDCVTRGKRTDIACGQ